MGSVDSRLVGALAEQFHHREAALTRGARHVGWKLGMGSRERIGDHPAVGYMTTATALSAGGAYCASTLVDGDLHADAELCVELGADLDPGAGSDAARAAIVRTSAALEIVDLSPLAGEPEAAVATNVFHRAVAIGDVAIPLAATPRVSVWVNGRLCELGPWPTDIPQRLAAAAEILAALGQRLRAGDRIITGSIVQVPIDVGDCVQADFGDYATIAVHVVAQDSVRLRRQVIGAG
jgi:2-keto-4-pentenoate hydratase